MRALTLALASIAVCQLCGCSSSCGPCDEPETLADDFNDGVINFLLWVTGGAARGYEQVPPDVGNWDYAWGEAEASDGYLWLRVAGPTSANTYGAEAWVLLRYDFNDDRDHLINFMWSAEVLFTGHFDLYYIQITDGYIPVAADVHWPNTPDAGTHDLLWGYQGTNYLPGKSYVDGLAPVRWSIEIDAAGTARLYDGPDATGTLITEASLDSGRPWYLRFMLIDATSGGFSGGNDRLYLYDFSAGNCDIELGGSRSGPAN
jgi:hypothetical protein